MLQSSSNFNDLHPRFSAEYYISSDPGNPRCRRRQPALSLAIMNIRDLRYLVAVADHLHFGRAAEACFVSQPTLSTQIKKLEEFLGVQLIERSHKQILITPVGARVIERARALLSLVDDIVEVARAASDPLSGELRFGLIPTIAPYLLPHLVPSLRAEMDRLRPLLYEDQTARLTERLRRGEVDVALMAIPVEGADLQCTEVFAEPFVVALPVEHPLAAKPTLEVEDLARQHVLLLEEGHCLRDQALDICNRVGSQREEAFRATSLETLRQMVAAGAGITLLPALAGGPAIPNAEAIALRPFRAPAPVRRMALYWRKGSAREQAIEALAELIRALPAVRALGNGGA